MPGFVIPEEELRQQASADSITHLVSGVAIVDGGKVLALRRAPDDFLGGVFELPGGGVEDGETFDQAVRRETLEEAGLEVLEVLGMFPGFDYSTPTKPSVRQFNFLVSVKNPQHIKLSDEHDQLAWLGSEADVEAINATDEMKTCFMDALELASDLQDMLAERAA